MTCSCVLRKGDVVTLCDVHEAALKKLVVENSAQIQKVSARLAPPFNWDTLGEDLYDAYGRKVARIYRVTVENNTYNSTTLAGRMRRSGGITTIRIEAVGVMPL